MGIPDTSIVKARDYYIKAEYGNIEHIVVENEENNLNWTIKAEKDYGDKTRFIYCVNYKGESIEFFMVCPREDRKRAKKLWVATIEEIEFN